MKIQRFHDRREAGQLLGRRIAAEKFKTRPVVLALPRGGVVIGAEIARSLKCPVRALIVRKVGVPFEPELAMGAIASGGYRYINEALVARFQIDSHEIEQVIKDEETELHRRERVYESDFESLGIKGKSIVIADDGIATGATMEVAIRAVQSQDPLEIDIAIPVAALNTVEHFHRLISRCFVLETPNGLGAIGEFYEEFLPVSDDEVVSLLRESH